jgi:hypothetical protein
MTLDELVAQLKSAFGAELRSVVLYGSAAAGEHVPKKSDYNVLVIVESLAMEKLQAASAIARAWGESGNPPPLILSDTEWRSSADIFPMEYADILERNRVLHGSAPFDGLSINPADLRLQVEHEAMGKLLKLRQGILAAGGDPKEQLLLLEQSVSTIMVVFRGVLRLVGERPPAGHEALCRALAEKTGVATEPFVRVVRHVRGEEKLAGAAVGETLAGYLGGVQKVVNYLDRYGA